MDLGKDELPPIGTYCQARGLGDDWYDCDIIAHSIQPNGENVAIYQRYVGSGRFKCLQVDYGNSKAFRSINRAKTSNTAFNDFYNSCDEELLEKFGLQSSMLIAFEQGQRSTPKQCAELFIEDGYLDNYHSGKNDGIKVCVDGLRVTIKDAIMLGKNNKYSLNQLLNAGVKIDFDQKLFDAIFMNWDYWKGNK